MRIAWATDVHLDYCKKPGVFFEAVRQEAPDLLLITGDISDGKPSFFVRMIEQSVKVPVCFVLGNHDFYGKTISTIRDGDDVTEAIATREGYLPRVQEPVELSPAWCLVGVDGWIDAHFGDFYHKEDVWLRDYVEIRDLVPFASSKSLLKLKLEELAGDEAALLRSKLETAFKTYKHVVVATHVPPFEEAAWYEGKPSGPAYLPHFSSYRVGRAIIDVVQQDPERRVLVLCGHTHGIGVGRPHPQVITWTGGAHYGQPQVQGIVNVVDDRISCDNAQFGILRY